MYCYFLERKRQGKHYGLVYYIIKFIASYFKTLEDFKKGRRRGKRDCDKQETLGPCEFD